MIKEQFVIILSSGANFPLGETTLAEAVERLGKVRNEEKDKGAQLFRQTKDSGAQLVSEAELPPW